jgi:hypothetical protein
MPWPMAAFGVRTLHICTEQEVESVRPTERPDAKLNKDRQQYVRCRVPSMSIGQDAHFQWLYRAAALDH